MKKVIPAALAAALLLCCTGCSGNDKTSGGSRGSSLTQQSEPSVTDDTQVAPPSPWNEHETLDDLKNAVDFPISFPESIDGMSISFLQEMGKLAEARYGDDKITLRKGAGTDDVSGDYNEYSEEKTLDGGITAKGENGLIKLAVWTDGEYSYSIASSDGISEETALELVSLM